jgi:5'-3' exonuclease
MDCNSIIYDTYRDIEEKYKKDPFDVSILEPLLIKNTIQKIEEYIQLILPDKCVYITFDGVAPFAKMSQQRKRRIKTLINNMKNPPLWDTTLITPGTPFMTNLSNTMYEYFSKKRTSYKILVSCSDKIGEGEHKLFHYVRNSVPIEDVIGVYGLDADLIMLSILHKKYCKNIYVFREAPTFKTVISSKYEAKELLFMDIDKMTNSIFDEMGHYSHTDKNIRVADYIFMCFLLGNDFLPHFPALNIRTHGIQVLTDTYYQTIGRFQNRSLIRPDINRIHWTYFGIFISELAKNERNYLIKEHSIRDKWDRHVWPTKTPLDIENLYLNLPVIYRCNEKYICPEEYGWEARYYKRMFDMEPTKENIGSVCKNYLEGLEWMWEYYIEGSKDWRWRYERKNAPLLKDMIKEMPKEGEMMKKKEENAYSTEEQKKYVIPEKEEIEEEERIKGYKRYNWE